MTAWAGTAIYGTKKAGARGRMTMNVQDDRLISGGSLDRYDLTIHGDLRIVMIPRSRTTKGSWPGHDLFVVLDRGIITILRSLWIVRS